MWGSSEGGGWGGITCMLVLLICCCAGTENWRILILAICVSSTNLEPSVCFVCDCEDCCPAVSVNHLEKMEQSLYF